jgi:hypothetical protein
MKKLVLMLIVACIAASASAVTINGLEGFDTGLSPSDPSQPASGWLERAVTTGNVTGAAIPGAREGSRYLSLLGASDWGAYDTGTFTETGTLVVEFSVYADSWAGWPRIAFGTHTGSEAGNEEIVTILDFEITGDGSLTEKQADNSPRWEDRGIDMKAGEWNDWTVTFNFGADTASSYDDTFDVSIYHVTSGTTSSATGLDGLESASTLSYGFQTVEFYAYSSSAYYVDAVPEPATIALLGLGGLFLRNRKRSK